MTKDTALDILVGLSQDWTKLSDREREALDMILNEQGRVEDCEVYYDIEVRETGDSDLEWCRENREFDSLSRAQECAHNLDLACTRFTHRVIKVSIFRESLALPALADS